MIGALLALVALAAPAPPLIYPLAHSPEVTSTFGTYRISHHHAGLDLTTGGSEAVAVRAAADGVIYRLKRGNSGYGRAIYIRHAGKWQTVYAHLSAFNPRLQAVIRAREAKKDAFRVALSLRKPIPVKAGELLGYVGTSGTDLVHLHFELRKKGSPVDPLSYGLPVPDTQPPKIKRLLAVPFDHAARVNGAHDEAMFTFTDGALTEPIHVTGDVRLSVEAPDRIDGTTRDLTPRSVELRIDGRRWHLARYDLVSYADMRQTELDFDAQRQAHREGLFNKLYAEGPRVRVHRKPGRLLTRLRRGDHRGEIIARDAAGHTTTATFTLRVDKPAPPCVVQRRRLKGRASAEPFEGLRVWRGETLVVQVPDLCEGGAARVDARIGRKRARWSATRLEGKPALAVAVPADEKRVRLDVRIGYAKADAPARWLRVRAFSVTPDAEFESGPVQVQIGHEALFFPYVTEITTAPNPGGAGLEAISPMVQFGNTWRPAKGYSRISIARPMPSGAGPHVGVYLHDRGRWWRMGGSEKASRVSAGTVHLGDLALMRDVWTPVIGDARVEPHPAGKRLIVPIEEYGAGLSSATLRVDGVLRHAELQRAFGRVVWLPWVALTGPHVIEVTARDRSGREATRSQTVAFGAPPAPEAPRPAQLK